MKNLLFSIVIAVIFFGITGTADANQTKSRICTPTEVAVFSNRIHVKCAVIKNKAYTADIPYYAMALKSDWKKVQLTMDVLLAAKANKRSLRIWVDMTDYKSVPGCLGSDCRRLSAVAIL